MTIISNDGPGVEPAPDSEPPKLRLVKPAPQDTEPILPMWVRDGETRRSTVRNARRRGARRALRLTWQAPWTVLKLVGLSPRGLGRLSVSIGMWVYDSDSAALRHEHATRVETPEFARAQAVRKANLHARWLVTGSVLLVTLGPVLAWTAPYWLSAFVGIALGAWLVKIVPGKSLTEIAVGAALALGTWWFLPYLLALIPRPPIWSLWTLGALVVLALGWHGRDREKSLVKNTEVIAPGVVIPLRAPMVREALCSLGIAGLKDPDQIRLLADVHRHGPGVQVDVELPGGVAAAEVVKRREKLAAALKRELGTTWPGVGRRNAAHLSLYVSDEPLAQHRQKVWPLADGGRVDIFKPQPIVTDQRGEWVNLVLAYAAIVIGAQPRMGKTFLLREALLVAGLDPRVKVAAFDGKGTGDLGATRLFADFYSVGDDPDEVEDRVLPFLRGLREEMRRRAKFIRNLPYEEAPESKVTSALTSTYRHLAPWVIGVDETQSYFSYGDKSSKRHKEVREEIAAIVTDLVRRGPALGFWVYLATQNVSEETIPRPISLNAVIRFALKVFDDSANNMILGAGAYGRGVDATAFDFSDKGIMWVRGDDGDPFIGRSVAGLDAVKSEAIAAKARAIRESAGTLSGDAAGEDAADEQAQVDLLADVRQVVDDEGTGRMHLTAILAALAALRPALYGSWDADALGSALRGAGVRVGQVKVDNRNTSGVRREWLEVAATSDVDPDDDGDEDDAAVVAIR